MMFLFVGFLLLLDDIPVSIRQSKINMCILCTSQTRTLRYDSLFYVYELRFYYKLLPLLSLKKVEKYTARLNIATNFIHVNSKS